MSIVEKPSPAAIAAAAWGEGAPEWVSVLAAECARIGQPAVAQRVGMSVSVINEVLRCKYKGRTDRVGERVKGALMGKTVDCPVLGELARDACISKQDLPFAATNPERVRLFRMCPKCPNYRGAKKAAQPEE